MFCSQCNVFEWVRTGVENPHPTARVVICEPTGCGRWWLTSRSHALWRQYSLLWAPPFVQESSDASSGAAIASFSVGLCAAACLPGVVLLAGHSNSNQQLFGLIVFLFQFVVGDE